MNIFEDKNFYRKLLRIAVPIAVQNLLMSSLSLVDIMMIGQLGESAIAAVSLGGQVFFLSTLLFFGISSGGAVFFAQFWGRKDIEGLRKTVSLVILLAETAAFLFVIPSILFPDLILGIFSRDQSVITAGSEYLKITGISFLFTGVSIAFSLALRSIGYAGIPLKATIVSISINTALNYIFIFGKFGFPEMGVNGAALATAFARFVEALIILGYVYRKKSPVAAGIRSLAKLDRIFILKYSRTTLPVVLNELAWATGMIAYKIVYARMGTESIAAMGIAETAGSLLFSFLIGTANACAIMTGNKIGEHDLESVKLYSKRFIYISVAEGLITGGILALLAPHIPPVFNVTEAVKASSLNVLYISAAFVVLKSYTLHFVIGSLRGGGDTTYAFITDITGTWLVGVPLAVIGGILLNLNLENVFLLISMEEVFKAMLVTLRYRGGKWIHDVTV